MRLFIAASRLQRIAASLDTGSGASGAYRWTNADDTVAKNRVASALLIRKSGCQGRDGDGYSHTRRRLVGVIGHIGRVRLRRCRHTPAVATKLVFKNHGIIGYFTRIIESPALGSSLFKVSRRRVQLESPD